MFTRGLMTTPVPIRAPKNRSRAHFKDDGNGHGERNSTHLTMYQTASTNLERPRSSPCLGLKRSFRTRVIWFARAGFGNRSQAQWLSQAARIVAEMAGHV